MLSLNKVSKTFHTGLLSRKEIIRDVNFSVEAQSVVGFLGPNGAGKSTIIKMIMDFIRPSSGEITINGCSNRESATRAHIGFLPEHPYFYDNLSARELLSFLGKTAGMPTKRIRQRSDQLLERLNLTEAANKLLRTYSKGMLQRAGFAAALIHDPDFLILDEPLSGLDPIGRHVIINLLLEQKAAQKTIFFSSHILNDIERLCDKTAILNQGRLLFNGDLESCIGTQGSLEKAFVAIINQDIKNHD